MLRCCFVQIEVCNSCATCSAKQKYKKYINIPKRVSKHFNCQFSSAPSTIVCQKSTFQTTKTLFSKAPQNHSVSGRRPTNGFSWKKLHTSFFLILFVTAEYCEHISTGIFPSLSYRDPATSISRTKKAFSIISQPCYSRVVGHQMGSDLDPCSSIIKVTHPSRCQSVESLVSGHCSDPHKTKPPRHCLHSMNRITCLIKPRADVENMNRGQWSTSWTLGVENCHYVLCDTFDVQHDLLKIQQSTPLGIVTWDGKSDWNRKEFNDFGFQLLNGSILLVLVRNTYLKEMKFHCQWDHFNIYKL